MRRITTSLGLVVILAACAPDSPPTMPQVAKTGADPPTRSADGPDSRVLAVWNALVAWQDGGGDGFPSDPAADLNVRGRTLRDYLPRRIGLAGGPRGATYEVQRVPGVEARCVIEAGPAAGGPRLRLTVRAPAPNTADRRRIPWPLRPGWQTIYGPTGRSEAGYRRVCRDAVFLARAVHRFMADGAPLFPTHLVADLNAAGRCVLDYMPGPGTVVNPFTGQRVLPGMHCRASYVGELCHDSVHLDGWAIGYVITARGLLPEDELELVFTDPSVIPD